MTLIKPSEMLIDLFSKDEQRYLIDNSNLIETRLIKFVDSDFYLQINEDVSSLGVDPLSHFIKYGWREGRPPNRWYKDSLVPKHLLEKNPSTPPYLLYLSNLTGIDEFEFEKLCASKLNIDVGHDSCSDCNLMVNSFDGEYYRNRYADIKIDEDALSHYCEIGWKEGRNPSIFFDTKYYLECNPDVNHAHINPFTHFLVNGRYEDRKPKPQNPIDRKLLRELKTIKQVSHQYLGVAPKLKIVPKVQLFMALLATCSRGKGLCISLSHDDYMLHTGGIQKFISNESVYTQASGYSYLHLTPSVSDIRIRDEEGSFTFLVNCTLDDVFIGSFTARELMDTFNELVIKEPNALQVAVIHSLMGWGIESIICIMSNTFLHRFFYVHDYFALCTEHRLLRNNILPCDAPPIGSTICNMCAHSDSRSRQLSDVNFLFSKLKPTLVYPSISAKKIFEKGFPNLDIKSIVVPHIDVNVETTTETETKINISSNRHPICIAFCGQPVSHKGYHHYLQIFDNCLSNDIEFYHLGTDDTNITGIKFIKTVMKDGKSQMQNNIKANKIDVVFIGSTWRETFNFVTYEAVQAGAVIIALNTAGNVCDFINTYNVGCVVSSWQECVELLKDKDIINKIDEWRSAANKLSFLENKSFLTEGVL